LRDIPANPEMIPRMAGSGMGFFGPGCLFPELNRDDDALLVAAGIIHVLDLVHCVSSILRMNFLFSFFRKSGIQAPDFFPLF
jgi:hypothetical protein